MKFLYSYLLILATLLAGLSNAQGERHPLFRSTSDDRHPQGVEEQSPHRIIRYSVQPSDRHISSFERRTPSIIPGRYVVEFSGDDAERDSEALLHHLKNIFRDVDMSTPRVFNHPLMRSTMLQINKHDEDLSHIYDGVVKAVSSSELVSRVYPSRLIPRPYTTHGMSAGADEVVENARLLSPHTQTQVDRVHQELNFTGQGIVIGILDTGIDYMHPALGGGFGEGYKVRYGRDLVGDIYDAQGGETPKPDDDPMESCTPESGGSGHGTHVAGIIAGKSEVNFTGVAPDATLGMWRIFGCDGYSSDETVIEAMLEAADTGVDIISMSLGDLGPWSEQPVAVLAERIADTGIKVVIAAGNFGDYGPFTVGTPSTGKGVISVGSFNSNYQLVKQFKISGHSESYAYVPNNAPSNSSQDIPNGEVVPGDKNLGGEADACDPETIPKNVKGKLALVQRGSCPGSIQLANLAASGARGMVFFRDTKGDELSEPQAAYPPIPLIAISFDTASVIRNALQSDKPVELTFSRESVVAPLSHSGNLPSFFSSLGPTLENEFQPAIGGIGGYVYSTIPQYLGGWATYSGTSMACPYISGATALYLNSLGEERASQFSSTGVLERFQNYAYKSSVTEESNDVDTPLRQGAGLIQLYDSITQPSHVSPGSISFNDTAHIQKTHTLTITNYGDSIVSYVLVNSVSVSIIPYNASDEAGYIFNTPPVVGTDSANLRFSKRSIKLSPGNSTTVTVSVIPPSTDPHLHIMYGGYVLFKSTVAHHKDMTVPYIGIVGNQHELPIFDEGGPVVTDVNMTTVYQGNDTYEFDRNDSDTMPIFAMYLRTGTKHISTPLYNEDGSVLGYAFPPGLHDYMQHTIEPFLQYYLVPWNGTYFESDIVDSTSTPVELNVKPGSYKVGFEALKIFGDPDNSNDWEKYTSCTIKVR
ncbi:peptidase S8/S53 domain-containing protein [Fennellomyces sp. T-0311]|nr:peptidase S8/S53 domain-containing protein [Fennellomyces sp. T-0311]